VRKPVYYNRRPTLGKVAARIFWDLFKSTERTLTSFSSNSYKGTPPVSPQDPTYSEQCVKCAYQTLITEAGVNLETFLNPNDTLLTASESAVEFNWGLAYRFSRIVVTVDPHGFGIPEVPLVFDINYMIQGFSFDCDGAEWVPSPRAFAMPVVAEDSDYTPDPLRLRLWFPTCPALTPSPVDFGLETVGWDEGITIKLVQLLVPALELEETS
jgi:hypothetical protein